MHKITNGASFAFNGGGEFKENNTIVKNNALFLHGYKIAWKDGGQTCFCLQGWNTKTTRERLKGLGLPISVKRGKLYFDNLEINADDAYKVDDGGNCVKIN